MAAMAAARIRGSWCLANFRKYGIAFGRMVLPRANIGRMVGARSGCLAAALANGSTATAMSAPASPSTALATTNGSGSSSRSKRAT